MDESKRSAVRFLEKEIKTYPRVVSLLVEERVEEHVCVGDNEVLINPTFYKERMKETKTFPAKASHRRLSRIPTGIGPMFRNCAK